MSSVLPPAGRSQLPLRPASTPADAQDEGLAKVYDLEVGRARLRTGIPDQVLAEMDAAARMYHALHAQGHELRFEQPADGGRVRAELRKLDGTLVRTVLLTEAIHVSSDPEPAA